jgi:hypothetical protein
MSKSIARPRAALIAAATICLLVMLATASQAGAARYYACVKKNGGARIYTKTPKCKPGESKLSWNIGGPAGRNGASGKNGANGKNAANGTNGANGASGQNLTSQTPLAAGQSESGSFAVGGNEGLAGQGISFSQPLAAPIAAGNILFNAPKTTSTNCPGVGQAARGFVCIYAAELVKATFNQSLNSNLEKGSDKFGFVLYFNAEAKAVADGAWTVTAP